MGNIMSLLRRYSHMSNDHSEFVESDYLSEDDSTDSEAYFVAPITPRAFVESYENQLLGPQQGFEVVVEGELQEEPQEEEEFQDEPEMLHQMEELLDELLEEEFQEEEEFPNGMFEATSMVYFDPVWEFSDDSMQNAVQTLQQIPEEFLDEMLVHTYGERVVVVQPPLHGHDMEE